MLHYIDFPKLGLHFEIDPVAYRIGGMEIYWYGIIISAAILVGFVVAMREVVRYGYSDDDVGEVLVCATVVGIICARLYYVMFNIDNFRDDLIRVFNLRTGGLAIYGGVIGALVAVYFYCRRRGYKFLNLIDVFIPYLALGQSIGRWGNFTNQEAFGRVTTLPWGMTGDIIKSVNDGMYADGLVHPTFLYESIVTFVLYFVLRRLRDRKKFDGYVLCVYVLAYSVARFFIEGLRIDSLMLMNFRVSKVLSSVLAIVSISVLAMNWRKMIGDDNCEKT